MASDITLAQLHRILQVVMGWTDSHLHQFIAHGVSYGTPHPGVDFGLKIRKEQHVTLDQVLSQVKGRCVYEYDFGDSWEQGIVLEAIVSPDA